MSKKIKDAREVMRKAFEEDDDFERVYVDNVAVLMMDETGLNHKKCNEVARLIIKRLFEHVEE